MTEADENERPPRRTLNKQEAIRHLLHTAIRLVMKMEDPFAIHLLVQSADSMLIDIAKKQSRLLRWDWEDYIKPEFHKEFFDQHRATANYFKHADRDSTDDLPVHDIMMINLMQLFMDIANYIELYKEHTNHMVWFQFFMFNVAPNLINKEGAKAAEYLSTVQQTQTMTPQSFFEAFDNSSHLLPDFYMEELKDLEDITNFYHTPFYELRAGRLRQRSSLRIPT